MCVHGLNLSIVIRPIERVFKSIFKSFYSYIRVYIYIYVHVFMYSNYFWAIVSLNAAEGIISNGTFLIGINEVEVMPTTGLHVIGMQ